MSHSPIHQPPTPIPPHAKALLEAIQAAGRTSASEVIASLCAANPSFDPDEMRAWLWHLAGARQIEFDSEWMVSPVKEGLSTEAAPRRPGRS